jgi:hypothetical protein
MGVGGQVRRGLTSGSTCRILKIVAESYIFAVESAVFLYFQLLNTLPTFPNSQIAISPRFSSIRT